MQTKVLVTLTCAAMLCAIGAILFLMDVSTKGVHVFFCATKDLWPNNLTWLSIIVFAIGIGLAILARVLAEKTDTPPKIVENYNQALVGLGFALALLAVLNFVALAGFASQGVLTPMFNPAAVKDWSVLCDCNSTSDKSTSVTKLVEERYKSKLYTLRLIMLPGFAVLGSLFFVAGTLRRKRLEYEAQEFKKAKDEDKKDPLSFDRAKLWSGLWYRLGEAVLFSLVIFMLQQAKIIQIATMPENWLLVVALLLGMFVKPAEQLINGIAVRLFKGIETMVK
ncbi:MAG: hypothetical protein O7G85_13645 [Planctomycetota bacterium]|nr:hypothetical protein [Planctomycetota bacterium]